MADENEIVKRWRPLITRLAKFTYTSSPTIDFDDLMRVGEFAAVRAVRTFDPSQGTKLSSFVNRLVRQAIYNEAGTFCGIFTVSHNITSLASQIHKLVEEGKTNDEIAEIMTERKQRRFDAKTVYDLRNAYEKRFSGELYDTANDDDLDIEGAVAQILEVVSSNDRERAIVEDKIVGNRSVDDLSEELGISPAQVRRIESILVARIEAAIKEIMA